ncbi:hypothetical protein Q0Z83_051020 [Actinoplanes sichuanensis]|uniref:Uncharacterized protein n=1 Tax=Actinoplanes sichuanensis TaxID=512349 RepID=A0ABW4API4_9ACTN|nr:hypothetical protein [Actinoplanes sichuanensis]BEL06911.1 hypothetical protein Q0Z83_051020 [Actinoplanes sichuanensis]
MSKSVTVLASLALAVLPAPAHAATRAAVPGEVTWEATQRRSPDADTLCRDGRANIRAKYTGVHGLTAMLVGGAKSDYADYPAFVRGPLIFSSSTFTGPDSHRSWISVPAPSSPGAEDGPAVLGVEVLDIAQSSRLLWFQSWDFPLACGYDYEVTIEDVDQQSAAAVPGA